MKIYQKPTAELVIFNTTDEILNNVGVGDDLSFGEGVEEDF